MRHSANALHQGGERHRDLCSSRTILASLPESATKLFRCMPGVVEHGPAEQLFAAAPKFNRPYGPAPALLLPPRSSDRYRGARCPTWPRSPAAASCPVLHSAAMAARGSASALRVDLPLHPAGTWPCG